MMYYNEATGNWEMLSVNPTKAQAQLTASQDAYYQKHPNIYALKQQILAQNTTDKWSGEGFGSAEANAADMAKILDSIGITDIKQFGEIKQTLRGEPIYGGEGDNPVLIGYGPDKVITTYGNKVTGQVVPNTYSERQTGNAWGGTFAGSGNTGYRVQFDSAGNPYFYTTGASSSDLGSILPIASLALSFAVPGLGAAIGSALGASGAAATAIGNAVIGGAISEASGGDFLQGALTSGAGSLLGGVVNPAVTEAVGSQAIGNALTSGALSELQGGDFAQGALSGALSGAISDAKLALAEDYINSIAPGTSYEANLPTSQDVLDVIAAEQPIYQISDTAFTPDYSLNVGAPVVQDMGAQGIQAPTINEILETIIEPIDYALPPQISGVDLQLPVIENLPELGGAQGITIPVVNASEFVGPNPSFTPDYSLNVGDLAIPNLSFTPDYSLNVGDLAIPEDVVQVVQAPVINDVIDVVGQPADYSISAPSSGLEYVAPPVVDTTFIPDYSLSTREPFIPEMGAQGIQAPTINVVIDALDEIDYFLPIPDSGIGLVMPTAPNLESMGGAQGITIPVSGGTLTEAGVIPETYIPVLGDETSFINQPAPNVSVSTPEVIEQPKDISGELAVLDVAKALAPLVASALTAGDVVNAISDNSEQSGYPILPVPAEWKSPEYSMAFTPSAPIDFGSRALLRGTQWENPVNLSSLINTLNQPIISPQVNAMMTGFQAPEVAYQTGVNDVIGEINGKPISIASIISGIQSGQNYSS